MFSFVAMERAVEQTRATDPWYRKLVRGRPLRSDAVHLSDEQLLDKLRSFDINLDRTALERMCEQSLSAEQIASSMLDERHRQGKSPDVQDDWIWICLATLWQRWFPDKPCFEMLDDQIQAGYDLIKESPGAVTACRVWLSAWSDVLRIIDKTGMPSIAEFDSQFRGSHFVSNWLQDLEDVLWAAGPRERQFYAARIELCKEQLSRFGKADRLWIEGRRRAIAESYFELGDVQTAEDLLSGWLEEDPQWGWGWITWSDYYRFTHTERKDLKRSDELLREGLLMEGVRNQDEMIERLAAVHMEQRFVARDELVRGYSLTPSPAVASPVRVGQKTGRNEPCPCGSGKKFKKCCGG